MATDINDQLKNLSPKPLDFYSKKQVGVTWVDWASIAEVQAAVPPSFLPNKEFYIAGVLYRTDNASVFSPVVATINTPFSNDPSIFAI